MPERGSSWHTWIALALAATALACSETRRPSDAAAGAGGGTATAGQQAVHAGGGGHAGGVAGGGVAGTTAGAGSSGSGGMAADAGTAAELCDGSDGVRLELSVDGGFVAASYGFTNPYGHQFAFVDGRCRFYAGGGSLEPFTSGTLDAATAAELARDIAFGELARWQSTGHVDAGCPDAGVSIIRGPEATVGCSCGCDPTAPAGLEAAMDAQRDWLMRLHELGAALDGPVRVAAERTDPSGAPWPIVQWPLSWPLAGAVVSAVNGYFAADAGRRIDDPAETQRLRELREDARKPNIPPPGIVAEDGGEVFLVYVRDELPDDFARAVAAFRRGR